MSEHSLPYFQRAELLIEISRYSEAIPELLKYLSHHPDDYQSLCYLARCYLELEDLQPALDFAKLAIQAEPESEWAYRLQSLIYARNGERDKALDAAEKSAALSPYSDYALQNLVYAQIEKWQLDKAEQTVQRMLEVAPDSADTYDACGYLAMKKEDWKTAETNFRKALEIDPLSSYSLFNLGVVYLHYLETSVTYFSKRRFRKKAIECFERAIKVRPTFSDAQHNLKYLKENQTASVASAAPLILIFFGCFLNIIFRAILFLEYLLNPYHPNFFVFGLNLWFILVAALVITLTVKIKTFRNKTERLDDPPFWLLGIMANVAPLIFYLLMFYLDEPRLTPFTIIALSGFSGGAIFCLVRMISGLLKKHSND